MEYYDLCVITKERNLEKMEAFIQAYIPEHQANFDGNEFTLTTYDGVIAINTVKELINTACHYKKSEGGFRIYGNSKLNPEGGWLYFNSDGTVVYGLTAKENTCEKFLKELKEFAGSVYGYIAGDCPPAGNEKEFIELSK